jgi:hypothetical protein
VAPATFAAYLKKREDKTMTQSKREDANDPIKSLLNSAAEDQREFDLWFSLRMGEFVGEIEDAGVELERIPKVLEDYAACTLVSGVAAHERRPFGPHRLRPSGVWPSPAVHRRGEAMTHLTARLHPKWVGGP